MKTDVPSLNDRGTDGTFYSINDSCATWPCLNIEMEWRITAAPAATAHAAATR